MKTFVWISFLLGSWASYGAGEYFACKPMYAAKKDPLILMWKGEGKALNFMTDGDLVREGGRLPEGTYVGEFVPSSSGFSLMAALDVSAYFPNDHAGSKGSKLSLSLSLKSSLFATEAYLLTPSEGDEYAGEILNNYVCRHHL